MSLCFVFRNKNKKTVFFHFPVDYYTLNNYKKKRKKICGFNNAYLTLTKRTKENLNDYLQEIIVDNIVKRFKNLTIKDLNRIGEMLDILDKYYPESFSKVSPSHFLKNDAEDIFRYLLKETGDTYIPKKLLKERKMVGLRLHYNKDIAIDFPNREDVQDCLELKKVEIIGLEEDYNRLTEEFKNELFECIKEKQTEFGFINHISNQLKLICSHTRYQEFLVENCLKYNYKDLPYIIAETFKAINKSSCKEILKYSFEYKG